MTADLHCSVLSPLRPDRHLGPSPATTTVSSVSVGLCLFLQTPHVRGVTWAVSLSDAPQCHTFCGAARHRVPSLLTVPVQTRLSWCLLLSIGVSVPVGKAANGRRDCRAVCGRLSGFVSLGHSRHPVNTLFVVLGGAARKRGRSGPADVTADVIREGAGCDNAT